MDPFEALACNMRCHGAASMTVRSRANHSLPQYFCAWLRVQSPMNISMALPSVRQSCGTCGDGRAMRTSADAFVARVSVGASRVSPPAIDDVELRALTGTIQLPELLRQRALTALRSEGHKQRIGLHKMIERARPEDAPPKPKRDEPVNRRELPFTRQDVAAAGPEAGRESVLAHVADHLPQYFASVLRPVTDVCKRLPEFLPRNVLDYGAGCGEGIYAMNEAFPDAPPRILAVEPCLPLAAVGRAFTEGMNGVTWSGAVPPPGPNSGVDLVLLNNALAELPVEEQSSLVLKLWGHCSGVMLIVDAGTPAGFQAVAAARQLLLERGPSSAVVAPCAHSHTCPVQDGRGIDFKYKWCHFSQRVISPSFQRATAKRSRDRAFTDWKFSYVAIARAEVLPADLQRPVSIQMSGQGNKHFSQLPSPQAAVTSGEAIAKWGKLGGVVSAPADTDQRKGADATGAEDAPQATLEECSGDGVGRLLTQKEVKGDEAGRSWARGEGDGGGIEGETEDVVLWGRVIRAPMKRSGHVVLDLCNADGALERRVIAKSHGVTGGYRRARVAEWGDAFTFSPIKKEDKAGARRRKAKIAAAAVSKTGG